MTAQQKRAPSCGHIVFVDVSIMKALEIVLGQLHKLLCALGLFQMKRVSGFDGFDFRKFEEICGTLRAQPCGFARRALAMN